MDRGYFNGCIVNAGNITALICVTGRIPKGAHSLLVCPLSVIVLSVAIMDSFHSNSFNTNSFKTGNWIRSRVGIPSS